MSSPLAPCPSCTRHVRVTETLCPFCATVLPDLHAVAAPLQRASRAGIYARGAARLGVAAAASAALALAGCSTTTTDDAGPGSDMATPTDSGRDFGGLDAAYGGPPDGFFFDAGHDAAAVDTGTGVLYGGPPDLGTAADAGAQDAGTDLGGMTTLYGVPPAPS